MPRLAAGTWYSDCPSAEEGAKEVLGNDATEGARRYENEQLQKDEAGWDCQNQEDADQRGKEMKRP